MLNDGHGAFRGALTGSPALNRGVGVRRFRPGRARGRRSHPPERNSGPAAQRDGCGQPLARPETHWRAEQPRRHRRARDDPKRRRKCSSTVSPRPQAMPAPANWLYILALAAILVRTVSKSSGLRDAANARKSSCRRVCLRARAPALLIRAPTVREGLPRRSTRRNNLDLDRYEDI